MLIKWNSNDLLFLTELWIGVIDFYIVKHIYPSAEILLQVEEGLGENV